MKLLYKGLLLALLHLLLVGSLGGKLLWDRARLPRVWVRAAPYDPDLPIRGRYVRLRLEVDARGDTLPQPTDVGSPPLFLAKLRVEGDRLVALEDVPLNAHWIRLWQVGEETRWLLTTPVAFFIPEHIPDPSRRSPDEELWVEVTVPRKGPPRPIRLGVKKDGALTPLDLN